MGFIPQVNTKTLYAYLTPLGRKFILDGDKEDFQIAFFSLHDDDVNYGISSNISAGTTYYTLPSGFIPDITGDNDTCIKSISTGTSVNMLCTLSGSSIIDPVTGQPTVGPIGSSGTIGGRNTIINGPTITTIDGGTLVVGRPSYTAPFIVSLTPPLGDNTPLTSTEIANSKFNVRVSNPSPSNLIGNFKINNVAASLDTDFLITGTTASQSVNIIYSILTSPNASQTITFDIFITAVNPNNTVNRGTLKYTAIYPVTTTSSSGVKVVTPTTPAPGTEGPGTGGGGGGGIGGGTGFSSPNTGGN